MKFNNLIFKGTRIYLRELEEKDVSQEYCNWLNDPIVNKFLCAKSAKMEELKLYVKKRKQNPNCLFFGIFLINSNKHIGNVKLEPIDWTDKRATLGICIGDKNYWGKGICNKVMKLIIEGAFSKLELEKIDLAVSSENKAAIICYLKAGLRIDSCIPVTDKYENTLCYRIIMSRKKNKKIN